MVERLNSNPETGTPFKSRQCSLRIQKYSCAIIVVNNFNQVNGGVFITEGIQSTQKEAVDGAGGQTPKGKMTSPLTHKMEGDHQNI